MSRECAVWQSQLTIPFTVNGARLDGKDASDVAAKLLTNLTRNKKHVVTPLMDVYTVANEGMLQNFWCSVGKTISACMLSKSKPMVEKSGVLSAMSESKESERVIPRGGVVSDFGKRVMKSPVIRLNSRSRKQVTDGLTLMHVSLSLVY